MSDLYKIAQRWNGEVWINIEFEQIKDGDKIKLIGTDSTNIFTAATDAVPCDPPGNWIVQAQHIDERK